MKESFSEVILTISPHCCDGVLVNSLCDENELVGKLEAMLQDTPKSLSIDTVEAHSCVDNSEIH